MPFNSLSALATFTISVVFEYLIMSVLITNPIDASAVSSSFSSPVQEFSLLNVFQTGPWTHPASFSRDTGGKAAGA
jgi:hypothetical protein